MRVKRIITALAMTPLLWVGVGATAAAQGDVACIGDCPAIVTDLGVTKTVQVNSGAASDADTSAAAVQATVGDTVTWTVTVKNTGNQDYTPTFVLTDTFPSANFNFVSATASAGTFDSSTMTWTGPSTGLAVGDSATLTVVSTASQAGSVKNTACLTGFIIPNDPGVYTDDSATNDCNDAFMVVSAKPAVLASTNTLVNTGEGTVAAQIGAGVLLVASVAVLRRRYNQ